MKIEAANKEDVPHIASAIMMALGPELCASFASEERTIEDVQHLFEICAESDDSQYSWRNALVARGDQGETMGIAVSYDGARLDELRQRFLDEFDRMHGYRIDKFMTAETTPDEYYLDSLAIWPEYRGRGVGKALISAVAQRASEQTGKPLGLLVDMTNQKALSLYNKMGFMPAGEREFAGEKMNHLLLSKVKIEETRVPKSTSNADAPDEV